MSDTLRLPSLKDLLQRLYSEHQPHYVYRGQIQEWPDPLVPSAYRIWGSMRNRTICKTTERLREIGSVFYEMGPKTVADLPNAQQAQIQVNSYLLHAFGFPLSQIINQQFGYLSNGVDVTSDLETAAFFSIYDFQKNSFISQYSCPGVIYRFDLSTFGNRDLPLEDMSFYNCSPYLDCTRIFDDLRECNSWNEALDSFVAFFAKAGPSGFTERPIRDLSLPAGSGQLCRVCRQHAGLIFPDMLLSTYYENIEKSAPAGKTSNRIENAVEDLKTRDAVEAFTFVHSDHDERMMSRTPEWYFPETDPLIKFLFIFLTNKLLPWVMLALPDGQIITNADNLPPPYMPFN